MEGWGSTASSYQRAASSTRVMGKFRELRLSEEVLVEGKRRLNRVRWEMGHSPGRPRKMGRGTVMERKMGVVEGDEEEGELGGREEKELSWVSVRLLGVGESGVWEWGEVEGGLGEGGERRRRRRR